MGLGETMNTRAAVLALASALIGLSGFAAPADADAVKAGNGTLGLWAGYESLRDAGGATQFENVWDDGQPSDCQNQGDIEIYPVPGNPTNPASCSGPEFDQVDRNDHIAGFASLLEGRFAGPLDEDLALQLDFDLGLIEDEFQGRAMLHLFLGDSEQGDIGLATEYRAIGDAGYLRLGGEAQGFWGDWTGYLFAGYQFKDEGRDAEVEEGGFVCGRLAYYLDPSADIYIGGGYGPADAGLGFFGAEYQPWMESNAGWTLTAEAFFGPDELAGGLLGVRYHFGAPAALDLMSRDRAWLPMPRTVCGLDQFETGQPGTNRRIWRPGDV